MALKSKPPSISISSAVVATRAVPRRMWLASAVPNAGSPTIGPNQCSTCPASSTKPGVSASLASLTITGTVLPTGFERYRPRNVIFRAIGASSPPPDRVGTRHGRTGHGGTATPVQLLATAARLAADAGQAAAARRDHLRPAADR